jgi:hypothetical protein
VKAVHKLHSAWISNASLIVVVDISANLCTVSESAAPIARLHFGDLEQILVAPI